MLTFLLAGTLGSCILPLLAFSSNRWIWVALVFCLLFGLTATWYTSSADILEIAEAQSRVVLVLLALLVFLGLQSATKATRPSVTTLAVYTSGLLAFIIRAIFPHQILHAELMGGAILDDYFRLPEPACFRPTFGQTAFVILGLPAVLWPRIATVTTANACFSALLPVATGLLVQRLSGRSATAVVTSFIIALHPCLVLVGKSEDQHTVGLCTLVLGWLLLDKGLIEGHRVSTAAGTALLALASWSRQTILPMAALPFLAALERNRKAFLSPVFLCAAGSVLLCQTLQVILNLKSGTNDIAKAYYVFAIFAVWTTLISEPHPFLHPLLHPFPLALCTLFGLFSVRRFFATPLALSAAFLWGFVIGAPTSQFGPGVQIVFRIPFLFVSSLLAGAGCVWLFERLSGWKGKKVLFYCIGTLFIGCCLAGLQRLSKPLPETEELDFLEAALPQLPSGTVVVAPGEADLFPQRFHVTDPLPMVHIPEFLRRNNPHVSFTTLSVLAGRPLPYNGVFYRGLGCFTVTLLEGSPNFREVFLRIVAGEKVLPAHFLEACYDSLSHMAASIPEGLEKKLRQVCFDEGLVGAPLDELTRIVTKPYPEYAPNLFYPSSTMEIGFYKLRFSLDRLRP